MLTDCIIAAIAVAFVVIPIYKGIMHKNENKFCRNCKCSSCEFCTISDNKNKL
ncbi:MAG: hypothetical protein LBJ95_02670 [Oscillospiraceae bacterium]|nr:hypothetical protein [Oscillospiraceae bacterium]